MACDKTTYETFAEAQTVVNKAENGNRFYKHGKRYNHRQTYKPKRAYRCERCGKYHLTSRNKK